MRTAWLPTSKASKTLLIVGGLSVDDVPRQASRKEVAKNLGILFAVAAIVAPFTWAFGRC